MTDRNPWSWWQMFIDFKNFIVHHGLLFLYLVLSSWIYIQSTIKTGQNERRSNQIEQGQNESNEIEQLDETESKFKVYIYEDELEKIREWVRMYDNIETGGDLFGLWINTHTVVVQLVLGPGANCRRTAHSFYQDIDYLAKCGAEITKNHGLCNIGQWHSHHRLGLPKPSGGDERTVWGNMPSLGLTRFIVCIATISDIKDVKVNPFLFEIDSESGDRLPVEKGVFKKPQATHSPLRANKDLLDKMKQGAESMDITKTRTSTYVNIF